MEKARSSYIERPLGPPFHEHRTSGAHGFARSALRPLLLPDAFMTGSPAPEGRLTTGKPASSTGSRALDWLMCPRDPEDPDLSPQAGPLAPACLRRPLQWRAKPDSMFVDWAGKRSLENFGTFFLLVGKKTSSKANTSFPVKQPCPPYEVLQCQPGRNETLREVLSLFPFAVVILNL